MSLASVVRLLSRLARSAAISLRTDASAERSLASASTSLRISGQHRAEQDRGAHRLQRVLRCHQHRRRRIAADALQRRQHIADEVAARVERRTQGPLLLVERRQPLLAGRDLVLDDAHARGNVDELAVELAAVVADLIDLTAQIGFGLARLLLLAAEDLQFLVALIQRVELGRAFGGGCGVALAAAASSRSGERCSED